jgi:hypothetical protein
VVVADVLQRRSNAGNKIFLPDDGHGEAPRKQFRLIEEVRYEGQHSLGENWYNSRNWPITERGELNHGTTESIHQFDVL